MKTAILICSNRKLKLHPETEKIIIKNQIPTIFIKQNLPQQLQYSSYPFIHELFFDGHGVSKLKNEGIKFAASLGFTSLAFTDDDCVLDPKWFTQAKRTLLKSDIVFGQSRPFHPEQHPDQSCPSIFSKANHLPINYPTCHWLDIGYGNNMAFTLSVFNKLGYFKEWLGPGSPGQAAEDAEIILRCLSNKFPIAYNPKMLIYHNKWLDHQEEEQQNRIYAFGGIAAYSYNARESICYLKILIKIIFQEIRHSHYLLIINSLYLGLVHSFIIDPPTHR
jgi:hypothetical protein